MKKSVESRVCLHCKKEHEIQVLELGELKLMTCPEISLDGWIPLHE